MRIELITNPRSGRGEGSARAAVLVAELLRRGHEVHNVVGTSREQAVAWAKQTAPHADRLVVVGGDGSLSAVVEGLPENPPPVLPFPLGTGNLLAGELRLPFEPLAAAKLLEEGRVKSMDLAQVAGRRAFMLWGFGLDGEIARRVDEKRQGSVMKRLDYLPALIETFLDWRPSPQEVEADGENLGSFDFGFVANLPFYGHPALRLGPSTWDDGFWELYLMRRSDVSSTGLAAAAAVVGGLRKYPGVLTRPVKQVRVSGDPPAPIQVDGDPAGKTPVEFRLDGQTLPLLVPA